MAPPFGPHAVGDSVGKLRGTVKLRSFRATSNRTHELAPPASTTVAVSRTSLTLNPLCLLSLAAVGHPRVRG